MPNFSEYANFSIDVYKDETPEDEEWFGWERTKTQDLNLSFQLGEGGFYAAA
jgi:hypothetical protein